MLVELGLVELRYQAVLEVLQQGATVTDVAVRLVQVAIVGETVEISAGGEVLRVHPIRHDRSREHGAFANAGGRPSRSNAA